MSDLGGVRNKLLCFLSTTPITLKSLILAQIWSTLTHRMPNLHCRCGGFNYMGFHGADIEGCSGEAPVVILGSLERGWLQIDVVVSGMLSLVHWYLSWVGNYSITLIHEGWLTRSRERSGTFVQLDGAATQLVFDLDCHSCRCCQMLATAVFQFEFGVNRVFVDKSVKTESYQIQLTYKDTNRILEN